MASDLGADVELARVPLKYDGLRPWEIWLSESQERMVLAVPPQSWPALQEIFAGEGVEATAIGHFTGDGRLRVRYDGAVVADLDCAFLHEGMPSRQLESVWSPRQVEPSPGLPAGIDLGELLERALADANVASKEPIVRQYDHEVQGRTVGKPFVGPEDIGPADAAVLRPLARSWRGLAVGCGINPWYGEIDPYAMALLAVDEALRNVVAVGADPARTAILDNFCWGNPHLPDRLGGLVRAAQGCHDAAVAFRVPFISGKDSLFNEYRLADGSSRPIPGTLLISAIGIVPDIRRVTSMYLKRPGNLIYLVGVTGDDLGGSLAQRLYDQQGSKAPVAHLSSARRVLSAVHRANRKGLIQACHDLSEGGLAVAAAEMAIAGGHGLEIDLRDVPVAEPGSCGLHEAVCRVSDAISRRGHPGRTLPRWRRCWVGRRTPGSAECLTRLNTGRWGKAGSWSTPTSTPCALAGRHLWRRPPHERDRQSSPNRLSPHAERARGRW